jgi:hypothetical protein
MRRIMLLVTVVALMMVMLAMSVAPAVARGCDPKDEGNPAFVASGGRCFHP